MMMDTFGSVYPRSLVRAARASVTDVLRVKKGESILIVTNPQRDVREISMALYDAASERGANATLAFQRDKGQFDFAEEAVIQAISSEPDIVLSISHDRLGKDRFGLKHGYRHGRRRFDHIFDALYEQRKMRSFWSPGVTIDTFSRTVAINYRQLRSDCAKLCKLLEPSAKVRVTAPGGTDVLIGTKGRKGRADNGDYSRPGLAGNIPAGEVYLSPQLGTMNGTIAFDGSIVLSDGEIVIRKPILAEVSAGFVTDIRGGSEADRLRESVKAGEVKARQMGRSGELKAVLATEYARNAWSIGELGIGLNRKARIVANMLEDEKVYGTCHFAVGSNYDRDAESLIHLDGLVKRPTITLISASGREDLVMLDGKLRWD
jgi:aminopeptidase